MTVILRDYVFLRYLKQQQQQTSWCIFYCKRFLINNNHCARFYYIKTILNAQYEIRGYSDIADSCMVSIIYANRYECNILQTLTKTNVSSFKLMFRNFGGFLQQKKRRFVVRDSIIKIDIDKECPYRHPLNNKLKMKQLTYFLYCIHTK